MAALLLSSSMACAALLGGPPTPYPTGVYDASTANAYYGRRPMDTVARGLQIALRSSGFIGGLLTDKLSGEEDRDEERGRELTSLLVELGPAFIKIGQRCDTGFQTRARCASPDD